MLPTRCLLGDLVALLVVPAMWRSQRLPFISSSDLRAFGHRLCCEVLDDLGGLEGSLEGPMPGVIMPRWRTIDELAEVPDERHGLVVQIHMLHDGILGQEVPYELVRCCTTCNSLMDHEDQMTPGHLVQLEEIGDVLTVLEGLVVRTSLHDGPKVRGEVEDLSPELPLEVLVARMVDLLEHPEARHGELIQVSMLSHVLLEEPSAAMRILEVSTRGSYKILSAKWQGCAMNLNTETPEALEVLHVCAMCQSCG